MTNDSLEREIAARAELLANESYKRGYWSGFKAGCGWFMLLTALPCFYAWAIVLQDSFRGSVDLPVLGAVAILSGAVWIIIGVLLLRRSRRSGQGFKRQESKSAVRPKWRLPVAISGGILGIVGIVGILIWALGGDDAGTPKQPVDDAATPLPDVTSVKKTLTPAQLAVGDPIENSIGMVLVPIPAGEFMMGSRLSAAEVAKRFGLPADAAEFFEREHPRHRVTLTKSFHLGRTEVTQGQWKVVMGTTPWRGKAYVIEGVDEKSHAATFVSWEDAVEFCEKLSEKEGVEYRLPTESEWEYACRAGTTTAYSFGDDESQLGEYAWIKENAFDAGEFYPHIVGQKKPNPWGLYDMHGNVFEWCQDAGSEYPSADVTDPVGPDWGSFRVFRGGSLSDIAGGCRSAGRGFSTPSDRIINLGFRVLRSSAK